MKTVYKDFTGKRRPRLRKMCQCGCNKMFSTTNPAQLYKNKAHKQAKYRAEIAARIVTNEVKK